MDTTHGAIRRTLAGVLAVASLTAVACSSSKTSTAAKAPVPYTADDGRFRAEFPSAPLREETRTTVAGIDLLIVTYSTEAKDSALTVGYTDYPQVDDPAAVLEAAAQGSASKLNGTVESKTDSTFVGQPAKDIVISTSNAGLYERMFLVGNRLYTLVAVAPIGRPAAYDHLLETFALL